MMDSRQLAILAAQAADHRKGEDILVLDVRKISTFCDFFVIVSGQAEPHLQAVRDEVEEELTQHGVKPRRVDGFPLSQWVVMDYTDVVVHIFNSSLREFYDLERLWGDALRVTWSSGGKAVS